MTMKYFRLRFKDGSSKIVSGLTSLEIIKKYDLCTAEHVETRITELSGEQLAIAVSNDQ